MEEKYIHSQSIHNLDSPSRIVPELIRLMSPKSVIDIGCGIGTFLYSFKQNGITDVMGIDGTWVDRRVLKDFLSDNEFTEADLEKEFRTTKRYDLVLSLEVAEHLAPESANIFVKNLISAGRMIVFSAAIPGQGGQHHINEQWLTYWEEKFARHGFVLHDILRPIFWDDPKIFWWYKQNMVVFAPEGQQFHNAVYNPLKNVVHYDLYRSLAKIRQESEIVLSGKAKKRFYAGLLIKSIIGVENFRKLRKVFKK